MHWYHWAQLAAFAFVAVIAWKTPRASLWVAMLACSYIASVAYIKFSPGGDFWPPSQFVGLILDGIVLIVLREFHRERWEYYGLGTILAFMVTADTIQLFGVLTGFPPPFSKNNFGVVLEALNYLALALIGGVGLMDLIRQNDAVLDHRRIDILSRTCANAHAETHKPRPLRKW